MEPWKNFEFDSQVSCVYTISPTGHLLEKVVHDMGIWDYGGSLYLIAMPAVLVKYQQVGTYCGSLWLTWKHGAMEELCVRDASRLFLHQMSKWAHILEGRG